MCAGQARNAAARGGKPSAFRQHAPNLSSFPSRTGSGVTAQPAFLRPNVCPAPLTDWPPCNDALSVRCKDACMSDTVSGAVIVSSLGSEGPTFLSLTDAADARGRGACAGWRLYGAGFVRPDGRFQHAVAGLQVELRGADRPNCRRASQVTPCCRMSHSPMSPARCTRADQRRRSRPARRWPILIAHQPPRRAWAIVPLDSAPVQAIG